MIFNHIFKAEEIVIYNYDIKTQQISFLFRGEKVPSELRPYPQLWRVKDKHRKIETIIISV
ncbi:MAG: hypothetical protein PHP32_02170 [Candidatus Izemoplasmatales bacterium]|nr:hypothetical protein [Candidatus Izemoplasmatales bacterium]